MIAKFFPSIPNSLQFSNLQQLTILFQKIEIITYQINTIAFFTTTLTKIPRLGQQLANVNADANMQKHVSFVLNITNFICFVKNYWYIILVFETKVKYKYKKYVMLRKYKYTTQHTLHLHNMSNSFNNWLFKKLSNCKPRKALLNCTKQQIGPIPSTNNVQKGDYQLYKTKQKLQSKQKSSLSKNNIRQYLYHNLLTKKETTAKIEFHKKLN
eukprot:TRINITY_DN11370_c0_g1_i1.p1 TRINITY_DN11370_c0_g1~~TRINITY_DN11370_c0_g1_i1.p1  ORF type:complete len:212 (-),score=-12.08 TRINITY_DN11370_c0_g1_i1:351-986(-)